MGPIAVVGAGGFVGGRLVQHLRQTGADVVPISRHPCPWLGEGNIALDLIEEPASAVDRAIAGAAVVIDLVGHNEVVAATEPERALTETVTMSHRLAEAMHRNGTPRVVYLSSVHVYGAALEPAAVITENTVPRPRSGYAIARLTSEHVLASRLAGAADVVVLRLTNSVGAPASPELDRWTALVNDLCRQAAHSGSLVLNSPGLQQRDWVSLGDACGAIAAACHPTTVPAGTYNLGSGVSKSVRAMAELVADAWDATTQERPLIEAPTAREAAPEPYQVDIQRLASLGIRLDTPIATAVAEMVKFCLVHRNRLTR